MHSKKVEKLDDKTSKKMCYNLTMQILKNNTHHGLRSDWWVPKCTTIYATHQWDVREGEYTKEDEKRAMDCTEIRRLALKDWHECEAGLNLAMMHYKR